MSKSVWWLVVALVFSAGCASGDGADGSSPIAKTDKPKKCKEHKRKNKSHGDCSTTTATVGATGGTVATSDGLTVAIPAGALDGPTTITVTTTDAAPPAGIGAVSPVYEFEPDGLVFASPIKVSLPLPSGVLAASVYWSQLGGTGFDSLGGTITPGKITVDTVHFSLAVIGDPSNDRTVTGVAEDTWISASSRNSLPSDVTGQAIVAIVQDSMGNLVEKPGTFAANGTFTIPSVPTGQYILHAVQPNGSHMLMVTSNNAPDLGRKFGGKPLVQRQLLTQPTTLDLTVNGLEPWEVGDGVEFWSSQVDDWSFELERIDPLHPVPVGATSTTFNLDANNFIYTTFGTAQIVGPNDVLTVAHQTKQLSSNNVEYQGMARVGTVQQPFSMLDGLANTASVTLTPITGPAAETLSVDYRGQSFVAALDSYGYPTTTVCTFCGGFVGALAQPGLVTDGFYSANADLMLMFDRATNGTNVITGNITFPKETALTGTWATLYDTRWHRRHLGVLASSTGPGPDSAVIDGVEWVTTKAALQAAPITPPLTPVRNATVNGVPFFAGGGVAGATPTIAWTAPATGTPLFYRIGVKELTLLPNGRTQGTPRASVVTSETSFTFPPSILNATSTYVFTIEAWASTSVLPAHGIALATAPFKTTNEVASATIASNVFGAGYAIIDVRVVKQDGLQLPLGAAHNSTQMFWAEHVDEITYPPVTTSTGRIWAANLDGSNPHIIATNQASPLYMTANDSRVYWSNQGNGVDATIQAYDLGTHATTTVVSEPDLESLVVAPNGDLVYSSSAGISVRRASGTIDQLTTEYTNGLAIDGTNAYFTQTGDGGSPTGRILSIPLAGGAVTELANGQAQPSTIATDGTNVYWFNGAFSFPNSKTLAQMPIAGGTPTVLATAKGFTMGAFTVSGGYVYFYTSTALKRVPVGGGAITMLATANSPCADGQMIASGGRITWLESCAGAVYQFGP